LIDRAGMLGRHLRNALRAGLQITGNLSVGFVSLSQQLRFHYLI